MIYPNMLLVQLKAKINQDDANAASTGPNLEELQKDYTKNKEVVVDLLVKNVLAVNNEIPKVVKGNYE